MIKRIQRRPILNKQAKQQAASMLKVTLPQGMQEILSNLNRNLHEAQGLIDQQLQMTRNLHEKAYADLQTPANPASASAAADSGPAPAASALPMGDELAKINAAINDKFAAMTQEIAKRSQQINSAASHLQNTTGKEVQDLQNSSVESMLTNVDNL